jgi:pentose-5-phosphate-3-epimerase
MTVKAGKSGQKRLDINKEKVISIASNNPKSRFIVDGGWSFEEDKSFNNIQIVSYTSFWMELESTLARIARG